MPLAGKPLTHATCAPWSPSVHAGESRRNRGGIRRGPLGLAPVRTTQRARASQQHPLALVAPSSSGRELRPSAPADDCESGGHEREPRHGRSARPCSAYAKAGPEEACRGWSSSNWGVSALGLKTPAFSLTAISSLSTRRSPPASRPPVAGYAFRPGRLPPVTPASPASRRGSRLSRARSGACRACVCCSGCR